MDDYLSKPVDFRLLHDCIAKWTNSAHPAPAPRPQKAAPVSTPSAGVVSAAPVATAAAPSGTA